MIPSVCLSCGHIVNVSEDRETSSLLHSNFSMPTKQQEYVSECISCRKYTVHRKLRKGKEFQRVSDYYIPATQGKNVAKELGIYRDAKKRIPRMRGKYQKLKEGY